MSRAALQHAPQSSRESAGTATSLRIGPAHDTYEHEADQAAEKVTSGESQHVAWSLSRVGLGTPPVQRECSCGGTCDDCKKKEEVVQRHATSSAAIGGRAPASVTNVVSRPGSALDGGTRNFMEARFGYDFSRVRIHTDSQAAESARDVSANAYTVGSSIVFNQGKYQPESPSGRKLLAHELAHVVQQSQGSIAPTVQRQRCGHDGKDTACGASGGVWKLIDQATKEAGLFAIDDLIIEQGLKSMAGGQWARQIYSPPNVVKNAGGTRGRIDGAKVSVGGSLDVELVEVKARSDDGGGCELATREANGYINELKTLAPLIVPMSAKLASIGGLKVDSDKCKSPKAADRKTLESAGVNFGNASSVNAWCFYNSLQDRLDKTFTAPFAAVNITANGDGATNTSYKVLPPVVINCKKTKKNPTGLGLRFLEYQVNQKGGVSYGCRSICVPGDQPEDEKMKEKQKDKSDDIQMSDHFRDIDKYDILDPESDERDRRDRPKPKDQPQIHAKPGQPDDDVLTPTGDTHEDDPVQLPPEGVPDWVAYAVTADVIATVAMLHQSIKALAASKAEQELARQLIEKTIRDGAAKGAYQVARKLDSANLTKYGTKAGDVILEDSEKTLLRVAPRVTARLGPKVAARATVILGVALAANDARAAISHVRKGGTIEFGPSLDDVDLSGDTKITSKGPDAAGKPSGDVALKDTIVDIETTKAPDVSGQADIEAENVNIHGAPATDDGPVTVNMKVKMKNTTVTFKSKGVVRDGKILAGNLDATDSQIEIDLPPGALSAARKPGEATTIKGAKIKVTAVGGGGGSAVTGTTGAGSGTGTAGQTAAPQGGSGATSTATPGTVTPGTAAGTAQPGATAPPIVAGPDRPKLLQQIADDKDLKRLYTALTGKEGVVVSDEALQRFVDLKPMIRRHPKALETVIAGIRPGSVKDPIKDIIEPIEKTLDQENENLRKKIEQALSGTPGTGQATGTPGGGQTAGTPGANQTTGTPGSTPGANAGTADKTGGDAAAGTKKDASPGDKSANQQGQGGTGAPGATTGTPSKAATAVKFSLIVNHLSWTPINNPAEGTQVPTALTYPVEWRVNVNGAVLTYEIPLHLAFVRKVPNNTGQNFAWVAEYSFSAPSGVFATEEGDIPLQFSDAGQGQYTRLIHPLGGGGRK